MIQSYPWYIADWRESETRISLSLEERGLYRELLDYCYLEGSLPADESSLAKLCACSVREFKRSLPAVLGLFERNGDRYIHRKVNEVRGKLEIYHEQRRHAGSKSGRARRERSLNARSTGVRNGLEPSPAPAPPPSPSHTQRAREAQGVAYSSDRFEEWIAPWPRVRNPNATAQAWISCVESPADEIGAFAARERYLASDEVARGVLTDPAKWLMEQKNAGWGGRWPGSNGGGTVYRKA